MNKLLATVSFLALGMAANAASAAEQRWPLWYVGLSGGVTFLQESDISGTSTGTLDYGTGGIGTVSLGYMPRGGQFINNMRIEAELGYHYNSLDTTTLSGVTADAGGHTQAWTYMGNLYYDFRNASQWTPYIGAGAGWARVKLSNNSGLGNTDGNDGVFAWQLMAGLSYAPTTLPNTEWSVGYRFFDLNDPKFSTATGSVSLDSQMSHTAEVGARFKF